MSTPCAIVVKCFRSVGYRTNEINDTLMSACFRLCQMSCCRLRQAKSRAEGVGMAAEDTASSAWNSDHRTGKAGSRRGTRGRSTPLQRAMDSKGVAAARKVLFASPRSTTFGLANKAPNTSAVGLAGCDELGGFNGNRRLLVERERRGAQYRKRLEVVLQQAVKVRRDGRATVDFSKKVEKNQSCPCMVRKGETATVSSPCSNNERHGAGPGGECGGCSLTAEMLSHLGPSPGITELELCVEGLTSASLLRACTSLKSLSLNVNRFSSPADLVVGTKLVRLSLRRARSADPNLDFRVVRFINTQSGAPPH